MNDQAEGGGRRGPLLQALRFRLRSIFRGPRSWVYFRRAPPCPNLCSELALDWASNIGLVQ